MKSRKSSNYWVFLESVRDITPNPCGYFTAGEWESHPLSGQWFQGHFKVDEPKKWKGILELGYTASSVPKRNHVFRIWWFYTIPGSLVQNQHPSRLLVQGGICTPGMHLWDKIWNRRPAYFWSIKTLKAIKWECGWLTAVSWPGFRCGYCIPLPYVSSAVSAGHGVPHFHSKTVEQCSCTLLHSCCAPPWWYAPIIYSHRFGSTYCFRAKLGQNYFPAWSVELLQVYGAIILDLKCSQICPSVYNISS